MNLFYKNSINILLLWNKWNYLLTIVNAYLLACRKFKHVKLLYDEEFRLFNFRDNSSKILLRSIRVIYYPIDNYYLVGCLKWWRKFIKILWTTLSLYPLDSRLMYSVVIFWYIVLTCEMSYIFDWRNSSTLNNQFCIEIIKSWGKEHIKHDLVFTCN